MKHKVSTLEGSLLDAAVAKAEGLPLSNEWKQGDSCRVGTGEGDLRTFAPSTDWAHGGPIIERERISISPYFRDPDGQWSAGMPLRQSPPPGSAPRRLSPPCAHTSPAASARRSTCRDRGTFRVKRPQANIAKDFSPARFARSNQTRGVPSITTSGAPL
jgi:hypothetical protein